MSTSIVGPTIQWVPGAPSLVLKRPGRKGDHSLPANAEANEYVELYLHSSIRLHGVVLSQAQGQLFRYLHLLISVLAMFLTLHKSKGYFVCSGIICSI
jgi:hypothetical protein